MEDLHLTQNPSYRECTVLKKNCQNKENIFKNISKKKRNRVGRVKPEEEPPNYPLDHDLAHILCHINMFININSLILKFEELI